MENIIIFAVQDLITWNIDWKQSNAVKYFTYILNIFIIYIWMSLHGTDACHAWGTETFGRMKHFSACECPFKEADRLKRIQILNSPNWSKFALCLPECSNLG